MCVCHIILQNGISESMSEYVRIVCQGGITRSMGRNWAMERDLIRPFKSLNWPHSRRWIPRKWNPKTLREITIYLDLKKNDTAMFNREIILADSWSFSPYFSQFSRVFPFPPFPGSSKKSHKAWHHPPASSWLMETAVCKVLAGGSWEPGSISTCSHLRCWVIGGDFNGFQWILPSGKLT